MSSRSRKRGNVTKRKRKSRQTILDTSSNDTDAAPNRKRAKTNTYNYRKKENKRYNQKKSQNDRKVLGEIDYNKPILSEPQIKQQLREETSILLQNLNINKFIEVGITLHGKGYSMIQGTIGTNGKITTKQFKTKLRALNAAVKVLTNKLQKGYVLVEEEQQFEVDASPIIQSSEEENKLNHIHNVNEVDEVNENNVNVAVNDEKEIYMIPHCERKLNHYFTKFVDTNHINQRVKDMVNGYIRNSLTYKIPKVIHDSCLIYIWSTEQFMENDSIKVLSSPQMYGQNDIIIDAKQSTSSSMGCVMIDFQNISIDDEYIFEWQFKVSSEECGIGITAKALDLALCYGWHSNGYLITSSHDQYNHISKIQAKFNMNDIIKMIVNLKTRTIKYYKNEIDVNIEIRDIDDNFKYHMAILMGGTGLIQLLTFESYNE